MIYQRETEPSNRGNLLHVVFAGRFLKPIAPPFPLRRSATTTIESIFPSRVVARSNDPTFERPALRLVGNAFLLPTRGRPSRFLPLVLSHRIAAAY